LQVVPLQLLLGYHSKVTFLASTAQAGEMLTKAFEEPVEHNWDWGFAKSPADIGIHGEQRYAVVFAPVSSGPETSAIVQKSPQHQGRGDIKW
jgi:hypothetical protein